MFEAKGLGFSPCRPTAGSDLCGCAAPDDGGDATPREALAYSLLTCPLLMLLRYKKCNHGLSGFSTIVSARVDPRSLNHIVKASHSIGPQYLCQHEALAVMGLITDSENARLISIFFGRRCGFSANCDIDKCIILPLNIIDWVPCISVLPARRNKELERWRYSINPGHGIAERWSGLTGEP